MLPSIYKPSPTLLLIQMMSGKVGLKKAGSSLTKGHALDLMRNMGEFILSASGER